MVVPQMTVSNVRLSSRDVSMIDLITYDKGRAVKNHTIRSRLVCRPLTAMGITNMNYAEMTIT